MKLAGYIRVSTKHQKKNDSHIRQREKLSEWADRKGHDITFFEDIAVSGQSKNREAYDEMMNRISEFDGVVVRELSRFGRTMKQVLEDVEKLGRNDIDFISLRENFDTSSAQGKLLFHVIASFNQFWADMARERTTELIEKKKENNEGWGRPKKLPPEKIRELVRDREQYGLSYNKLAMMYQQYADDGNLHRSTVKRYVEEFKE